MGPPLLGNEFLTLIAALNALRNVGVELYNKKDRENLVKQMEGTEDTQICTESEPKKGNTAPVILLRSRSSSLWLFIRQ